MNTNIVREAMVRGNYPTLGQVGPLPDISIDPNLLLLGAGLLGMVWLWRGTTSRVASYTSRRRKRARLKQSLKEQLRSL